MDRLDLSLFDEIPPGGMSSADRRSLLAVHAALASRGEFRYLEVGSFLGASLQAFIVDPRCREIVSIDRRDAVSPDARSNLPTYPDNTRAHMLDRLSGVPGADLSKLTTIDLGTDQLDHAELSADLCFIDAEHTGPAALRNARFCRRVVRDRGILVFHDRTLVDPGIRRFLGELPHHRAYPLSHELFVVEIGVPSLLSDARVKRQVPRSAWLIANRIGQIRAVLSVAALARRLEAACGRILIRLGAPRRRRGTPHAQKHSSEQALFELSTFVNDDQLYRGMRESFIAAGFSPDAFVRLTDDDDDPYTAITRIGQESTARYPILCHQDVRPGPGAGVDELVAALEKLDTIDPSWTVAGTAGITEGGRWVCRIFHQAGGPTSELSLPLPVGTLEECFLVFNSRHTPRCSAGIGGFHLYGSDVCLQALTSGGTGYVIDFPIVHLLHLGSGMTTAASVATFETVKARFIEIWSERFLFCYVVSPCHAMFMSRSRILRRLFGSAPAMSCIGQALRFM